MLIGLVSAISGVLPLAMAELAPWRVRCTVISIAYNLGMAVLGGKTPRGGVAPVAIGLRARAGVVPDGRWRAGFVAAILLPKALPHRLTT